MAYLLDDCFNAVIIRLLVSFCNIFAVPHLGQICHNDAKTHKNFVICIKYLKNSNFLLDFIIICAIILTCMERLI